MKKLFTIILLVSAVNVFAQEQEKEKTKTKTKNDPTNWFIGGSVSFNVGGYDNSFLFGIHPHVGYTITNWLDVAAVVNFEYLTTRDVYNNKYRNTTYGIGAFTRIYPAKFLFLQVEPEFNFIGAKFIQNGGPTLKQTVHAPSLLLGAGYTTSKSDKNTFTYFSLLIDVLKDVNSPYVDGYGNLLPVVRAGINIGLGKHKHNR